MLLRVLNVDDEKRARFWVAEALGSLPAVEVLQAACSREMLQHLYDYRGRLGAILLDWCIERPPSSEANLYACVQLGGCPVVILTNNPSDELLQRRALEGGALAVVGKGITPEDLADLLGHHVEQYRARPRDVAALMRDAAGTVREIADGLLRGEAA